MDECSKLKQAELHVLGWEWEMGLAGPNNDYRKGGPMHEVAKRKGIKRQFPIRWPLPISKRHEAR